MLRIPVTERLSRKKNSRHIALRIVRRSILYQFVGSTFHGIHARTSQSVVPEGLHMLRVLIIGMAPSVELQHVHDLER